MMEANKLISKIIKTLLITKVCFIINILKDLEKEYIRIMLKPISENCYSKNYVNKVIVNQYLKKKQKRNTKKSLI